MSNLIMDKPQVRTRVIRCPVCVEGRVLNASVSIHPSHIQIYPPEEIQEDMLFIKCPRCKNQVGFTIK